MRPALRHQHPPDRRAATRTRLAGLLIYLVTDLKASLPPIDIDIIRNGRSARPDGFLEYLPDRRMQLLHPVRAQPRRHRQGMNARAEQRLVRIYIPDAAQESLIQQQRF